ncbi:MAG: hypothetical protein WKF83_09975 [Nocardioidaceae bacterium]
MNALAPQELASDDAGRLRRVGHRDHLRPRGGRAEHVDVALRDGARTDEGDPRHRTATFGTRLDAARVEYRSR